MLTYGFRRTAAVLLAIVAVLTVGAGVSFAGGSGAPAPALKLSFSQSAMSLSGTGVSELVSFSTASAGRSVKVAFHDITSKASYGTVKNGSTTVAAKALPTRKTSYTFTVPAGYHVVYVSATLAPGCDANGCG